MESSRQSFLICTTYNVLPTPKNLKQWLGKDPSCPLCSTPATPRHILTGCKVSLSQEWYTWRHNQVLKCLATALESKGTSINALPPRTNNPVMSVVFVREREQGQQGTLSRPRFGQLKAARNWQMIADMDQRLVVPPEIATTNLRPDLILWSNSQCMVHFVELTVPWEDAVQEDFERKKLRYTKLAAEAEQRGWRAKICTAEVRCQGFVATPTVRLMKDLGISGRALRQAIKETSTVAERSIQLVSQISWTSRCRRRCFWDARKLC